MAYDVHPQVYLSAGIHGSICEDTAETRLHYARLERKLLELRHTQYSISHGIMVLGATDRLYCIVSICLSSSFRGITFSWGILLALSFRP